MSIAVLGWGSLVPRPENLEIGPGPWRMDGPDLPIEFARRHESCAGRRASRISLVIVPGMPTVKVLWNRMITNSTDRAVRNLAEREEEPPGNIGFIDLRTGERRLGLCREVSRAITGWAGVRNDEGDDIDAVIWTNLAPNFEEDGTQFTAENLLNYLNACPLEERERTERYVRTTPPQIRTAMREVMERELGWAPYPAGESQMVELTISNVWTVDRTI